MDKQTANQVAFLKNVVDLMAHLKRFFEHRAPEVLRMPQTRYNGKSMLQIVWGEGAAGVARLKTDYS